MSLNELVQVNAKPWLNIKAKDVIIDGNLSVVNGIPDSVLNYVAPGEVKFTSLKKLNVMQADYIYIDPILATSGAFNFSPSYVAPTLFTIAGNNLTCLTAGKYKISLVVTLAAGSAQSRINPYITVNSVSYSSSSIRNPLTTVSYPEYTGMSKTFYATLAVGDVVQVLFATQPNSVLIQTENQPGASNIIFLKMN